MTANRIEWCLPGRRASLAPEPTIRDTPHASQGLAVHMVIHLPGLDRTVAQDLVDAAHHVCPYSNATRGNIEVGLRLA